MKRIIVVVDMQNDFVTGVLGTLEAKSIVPNIEAKLQELNSSENLILFTKDTHQDSTYLDTHEGQLLPIKHCIEGTPGHSLVKTISDMTSHAHFLTYSDFDIIKSRIEKDTFGSIKLGEIVKKVVKNHPEIEEVLIMGVCTDICVVSNALLLRTMVPEVKITVEEKCCAGTSIENHYSALKVMESCQINVVY